MSGTVSGSLWGLALGVVGLGVASLVNEQPGGDVPPVSVAEVEEASGGDTDAVVPTAEPGVDVALVDAEATIDTSAPQIDTNPIAPLQIPDVTSFSKLPEALPELDLAGVVQIPALQPRFEGVSSAPILDSKVVITTQSAPAPATVPAPVEGVPEDTVAQIVAVPDVTEPDVAPEQAEPAALPDVQAVAPTPAPVLAETAATPVVTETAPAPVVETPSTLEELPGVDDVAVAPDAAAILPETPPADAPTRFVVGDSEPQSPEPVIVSVTEPETEQESPAGPAVRVNRPGAEPAETAGQEAEVVEAEPLPDDAPALERYATAFEGDAGLPLIAIVMLDAEDMSTAPADIAALPVPVTVVIDALSPTAAARMADYRAAGVEVMLQTALPPGAIPTDVEVAFEAAFAILPETVALFSDASGILQGDRSVAVQVIDILGAEGRGLVVVERGLSSSLRIAEQADLPAAAVLRDLDGDGEDGAAVTRALDQAAFRARQTGNAVLLARVSPETLAALQGWGAANDNAQIALAPVSAVLKNADGIE